MWVLLGFQNLCDICRCMSPQCSSKFLPFRRSGCVHRWQPNIRWHLMHKNNVVLNVIKIWKFESNWMKRLQWYKLLISCLLVSEWAWLTNTLLSIFTELISNIALACVWFLFKNINALSIGTCLFSQKEAESLSVGPVSSSSSTRPFKLGWIIPKYKNCKYWLRRLLRLRWIPLRCLAL